MKKLIVLLFILLASAAYCQTEIEIHSDCVYLNEILGDNYTAIPVQCGFQPGAEKILTASVVMTSLKRAGLPIPELENSYTVKRYGIQLLDNDIQSEVEYMYREAYPDSDVKVENVRVGRIIYVDPEENYRIEVDLNKFGSTHGSLISGTNKYSFSFTVKIYADAYVAQERILSGEVLFDKVKKERIDITTVKGSLVKDAKVVIASKSISKGRVVTEDMVETRPDRVKGDIIALMYDDGDIKLEISVVAEGNAVVGKSFPVRNPTSGKVFNAIYVGDGKAIVK